MSLVSVVDQPTPLGSKRKGGKVVLPGPRPKKQRLLERRQRNTDTGTFSVATEDLYHYGGDAVLMALQFGKLAQGQKMCTMEELPEFLDFSVGIDEIEGTGFIMCLTKPLEHVEFTHADSSYGLMLCVVRMIGVNHT